MDNELIQEREEILNWFIDYDLQCNQYRRKKELGIEIEYDRDIIALHEQAEINAARLKEIKATLAP